VDRGHRAGHNAKAAVQQGHKRGQGVRRAGRVRDNVRSSGLRSVSFAPITSTAVGGPFDGPENSGRRPAPARRPRSATSRGLGRPCIPSPDPPQDRSSAEDIWPCGLPAAGSPCHFHRSASPSCISRPRPAKGPKITVIFKEIAADLGGLRCHLTPAQFQPRASAQAIEIGPQHGPPGSGPKTH